MEFVAGNIGWIEVICGPMFSGKSEELIRRLRRAMIARRRVQVFKPVIDDRYSESEIVSHGDQRMRSEVVSCAEDILAKLDWRTQVVGIDEPNFLGPELIEVANQLADSGKQVIIAGLDTDYMGRPFSPIPELLALRQSGQAHAAAGGIERPDCGGGGGNVRGALPALFRAGRAAPGTAGIRPSEAAPALRGRGRRGRWKVN
jgi:hypothetical protein